MHPTAHGRFWSAVDDARSLVLQNDLHHNPYLVSANGAYEPVRVVETPDFTRAVTALLDEEQYGALQLTLALRPEQGDVIWGSGGLRKLR